MYTYIYIYVYIYIYISLSIYIYIYTHMYAALACRECFPVAYVCVCVYCILHLLCILYAVYCALHILFATVWQAILATV